ncbi:DUF2911 domain-containing protein [Rosettibacter firmus]|uniref:DUF2911 domain-containing protein n=1 Tax=Rosettibacter firmus TaxID=3111522 RepID=UPI00336BE621
MNRYLLSIIIFTSSIFAQIELPRLSPKASVSQTIGYTVISIEYSRPGVKGRKIWGDLVPYNKVWRTGANESTRITFTTDVIIEGNKIPAGIYSLYTIPNENEWTVIINKALTWGINYYPEQDVLRFNVKPESAPFTERLLFTIPELTDSSCNVVMNWENLQISFKVEVELTKQVYEKIKNAIANAKNDDWQIYVVASNYAAEHNVFLDEAFQWIDKALSMSKNFNCYLTKAKLYFKKNNYVDALKMIDLCREAGRNDEDYQHHLIEIDLLEKQIKENMK